MADLREVQKLITRRDSKGVNSLDPITYEKISKENLAVLYQSNALVGEAGEFANIVKKIIRDDMLTQEEKDHNDKVAKELGFMSMKHRRASMAAKELGDIIMYCGLAAEALRIDLDEAVIDKFNEVSRKMNIDIMM